MEITEASIRKFFDYSCTVEEASLVATYLKENQDIYNSVLENEWNSNELVYVEAEEYFEIERNVWNKIFKKKRNSLIKIAVSIAACFVLFFSVNVFLTQKNSIKNSLSKNDLKTSSAWNIRMNVTDKESWTHLEDGSDVKLQKGSSIKYQSLVQGDRRDVYLEGEAFFKVAKNKKKPFTVWASGITTTALGTQFTVAMNKGKLIVKLFEGKVVIKPMDKINRWKQQNVYLTPGKEFVYDSLSASFVVKPFKIHNAEKKIISNDDDSTQVELIKSANWYMFNNQPLVQVFKQLEEVYNVHIEYREKDFESVYFIGKFDKDDSVEDVLNNIVVLKKLRLTQKGNTYIIKK